MAHWKQIQHQPFTTYRDPKTGQWIVVKSSESIQDELIVESPIYRDPQTGQWITVKPTIPTQNPVVSKSV